MHTPLALSNRLFLHTLIHRGEINWKLSTLNSFSFFCRIQFTFKLHVWWGGFFHGLTQPSCLSSSSSFSSFLPMGDPQPRVQAPWPQRRPQPWPSSFWACPRSKPLQPGLPPRKPGWEKYQKNVKTLESQWKIKKNGAENARFSGHHLSENNRFSGQIPLTMYLY